MRTGMPSDKHVSVPCIKGEWERARCCSIFMTSNESINKRIKYPRNYATLNTNDKPPHNQV